MSVTRWSAIVFARAVTRAVAFLVIGVLLFVVGPGCSKSDPTSETSSGESNADSSSGDAGADEIATDMNAESFDQLKQMFEMQVAGVEAQADTITKAAAEHSDDQLNDLVNTVKSKTSEIRRSFDAMKYPESVRAIQSELPKSLGEAGELIAAATERLQAVLRVKAGLPPITPG